MSRHALPVFERYEVGEGGCWNWLGNIDRNGYGRCKWMNRQAHAHRVFFIHRYGDVPEGREVHHVCRNRRCVNPDHLRAVTRAENTQDGASAKLTPDDVREIRRVMKELCDKYDMSPSGLRMVADRKSWKDID